jgi:predicted Fe-Mo cluster-binding NifX family protein
MRVAVLCECLNDKCWVSHHFGMAPFICIFEDGRLVEKVRNPYVTLPQGKGRAVAEFLASKGVEVVIGPEAQSHGAARWVEALGMRVISAPPRTPVEEALRLVGR